MRFAVLVAALLASPVFAQGADHLIGRPYAGLPTGWGGVGGMVLPTPDGTDVTYLLEAFKHVDDDRQLFTYSRIDQLIDDRYPVSTVLAALVVEDIDTGEVVAWAACSDDQERPLVTVLGEQIYDESDDVFRYGPVRLAWALDQNAAQFVPADPATARCVEEAAP